MFALEVLRQQDWREGPSLSESYLTLKSVIINDGQAFVDPSTPTDAEPRWSIEVRTVSLVNID